MLRADPDGRYDILDSSPIEKLGLEKYEPDKKTGAFTSTYKDFGSDLMGACNGGLYDGCAVCGQTYEDGSFDVCITLDLGRTPRPWSPEFDELDFDAAYLYVRSSLGAGLVAPHSAADLVYEVHEKKRSRSRRFVHGQVLACDCQEALRHRYTTRRAGGRAGYADAPGGDMASLVAPHLGFSPDFAALLPGSIPYAPNLLIRQVACRRVDGQSSVRVELGTARALRAVDNLEGSFSKEMPSASFIDDLVIAVGTSGRGRADKVFVEAAGRLTLAGVPIDIRASYPLWRVNVDVLPERPVALGDIAAACGAAAPPALAGLRLESGAARFALEADGCRGAPNISSIDFDLVLSFLPARPALDYSVRSANDGGAGEGAAVRFEHASAAARRLGSILQIEVGGDLVFYSADSSYLFGLSAQGSLTSASSKSLSLTACLRPQDPSPSLAFGESARLARAAEPVYPSFSSVYKALSGKQLPSSCPDICLTGLTVALEYASSLSVKSFAGSLRVSTADRSVFGCDLAFAASLDYRADAGADAGIATLAGSFALEGRFSLEARVVLADAARWSFQLVVGSARIDVAYAENRLTATIAAELTLGDAVDALMRLFDPSSSFCRTGSWSFLNGIGLKGSALDYDFATKRLRVVVKPSCSIPFVEMSDLAVVVDPARGVVLEVTGTFDGVCYPADKPLSFSPNDPPSPSGNALEVAYLALAEGILIGGEGRITKVDQALALVEEVLNAKTSPTTLVLDPRAGALMGADFTVAQCVRVKLLYDGRTTFIGGRFTLFGSAAGPLVGLEVELSYVKLNSQLGVFSAEFVPPQSLRSIKLGAITVGVGRLAASIYTNGDFTIDLGFPEKGDFTRSFTLSYGVFDGAGGVYVKKLSTPAAGTVPESSLGRFSPVLQMGVGMRLSLSKEFRAGILSASAFFSMQGMFEGVYATFLPYGSVESASYYKLDAAVVLDGRIQGSVNFGLIGAAVTLQASAHSSLRLEAGRAASVEVSVRLAAQASLKVVFVRIRFSFDLFMSIDFTLGSGGKAPWRVAGPGASVGFAPDLRPLDPLRQVEPPASLKFPLVDAQPQVIGCRVFALYTRRSSLPAAAFLASVSASDFAALVQALASFAEANGYLDATCGLELFNSSRLFGGQEALSRFLEERFVFQYSFAQEAVDAGGGCADALAQDDVLMPLPGWLVQTVRTRYLTGATDVSQEDLSASFMVDDSFVQAMREYYALTSEDNASLAGRANTVPDRAPAVGQKTSLASKMFTDYFELLVKAIRAEKHSAGIRNRPFDSAAISDGHVSEIAGMAQHFFLGGHRVLENAAEEPPSGGEGLWPDVRPARVAYCPALVGNFEASGELMYVDAESPQFAGCTYAFSPARGCPSWIRLRGGDRIALSVDASSVRASLPAAAFADDARFVDVPAVRPFFEDSRAAGFSLPAVYRVEGATLYDTGEQMVCGSRYFFELSVGDAASYVGLCAISLLSCSVDPPLFAIVGASRTGPFELWRSAAAEGRLESVRVVALDERSAPANTAAGEGTAAAGECCYLLAGEDGSASETVFAPLSDAAAWLGLLARACASEQPYYLGYSSREACPFVGAGEVEALVVVRHAPSFTYPQGFDAVEVRSSRGSWLRVLPRSLVRQALVPQGRLALTTRVNGALLPSSQQALFDLYANMAVRRQGPTGRETPPFAAREEPPEAPREHANEDASDRRLTAYVPYALEYADRYEAVRAGHTLVFEVLWVDVLGNCMPDPVHRVRYAPRYIDDVTGFGAYAGMCASFRLQDDGGAPSVAVTLLYRGDGIAPTEVEALVDAILQLEQPDVTMTLSSPLCGEVSLDKPAWLGFLRSVRDDPARKRSFEQRYALSAAMPAFAAVEARVIIARDGALVEPNAPESAHASLTALAYADADFALGSASSPCMRHTFLDAPFGVALYEGTGAYWALRSGGPPFALSSSSLYAFRVLPLVSGRFCAPEAAGQGVGGDIVQMNDIDLQHVLQTFLSDLAFLLNPAQLSRLAAHKPSRAQLVRLYRLRSSIGAAVSRRVAALAASAPPPARTAAARQALAATVSLHPDIDLGGMLVAGADVSHNVPAACGLDVHGLVGEGAGMPARVRAGQASLGVAVQAQGGRVDCSSLAFKVRRLRSAAHADVRWYTPRKGPVGFDEVPLGLAGSVVLPGMRRPASPSLVAAVPSAGQTSITVDVAPFADDRLEFCFDGFAALNGSGAAAVASPLYWMECYRRDSPALIEGGSAADREELLALMESYVSAVAAYEGADAPDATSCQVACVFRSDASGYLSGFRVEGEVQRIAAVSYCPEKGAEVPCARTADVFAFAEGGLVRQGGELRLSLAFADPAARPCAGRVRTAFRPRMLGQGVSNPDFDQVSAELSF